MKKVVFTFSGQGSQYFHMGESLYNENPIFSKNLKYIDDIIKNNYRISILDNIYDVNNVKSKIFNNVIYSHPAIFMLEYALAQALMAEGIYPDYLMGSSMGEFAAIALSGMLDLKDTIDCLMKQAILLNKYCSNGSMLAVFDDFHIYHNNATLYESVSLAGVNYDKHFVLSGEREKIAEAKMFLKQKSITCIELPVKVAFHSGVIDRVGMEYKEFVAKKQYRHANINLVSGIDGTILNYINPSYSWDIIRSEMNIKEAVRRLENEGDTIYIDLGPSGTQINFIKNLIDKKSSSEIYPIINLFDQDTRNFKQCINKVHVKNERKYKKEGKKDMKAYVFPGQGSQKKGMGRELFRKYHEQTKEANEILGYSIEELCLEDEKNQLGITCFTQPALYVVETLSYLDKIEKEGKPDYVAGHSLGEYSALFASGVLDFGTGLRIVKKRGELMYQAKNGGMAAVIGIGVDKIKEILQRYNLAGIDVANYNSPSQTVLSGLKEDILKAQPFFEQENARYVVLNVSGAFHSRYMEQAKRQFKDSLAQFEFKDIQIPIISNVEARLYKRKDIMKNLCNQITSSVMWVDTIRYLMGKGVECIEQVGPGNALQGFTNAIKRESQPLYVEYSEIDNLKENEDVFSEKDNRKEISLPEITAKSLGSKEFKKDYNLKYAYITGSMYRGIASKEIVIKMGKAGMLGFLGTGGMDKIQIENNILHIKRELNHGEAFGMNLLHNVVNPQKEEEAVDLYIKHEVHLVEASAYMSITPSIARYRLTGLQRGAEGQVIGKNHIIAKVSRPEVAEAFLSPAPDKLIKKLLTEGKITANEAELAKFLPMADDICVEADSGGHTDGGVAYAMMPTMIRLRDRMVKKYDYKKNVRIGSAGGIGTPDAVAAALMMGAEFIVTGSINECTVEAGVSDLAKDLLQQANIQDTDYAPAGDMFEMGAKVQVLKKGLFFPSRANKLYELYKHYNSLDEIEESTKKQIEERYFHRSFDSIFEECKKYYSSDDILKAQNNPKQKMAMVFRWYFGRTTRLAIDGDSEYKVDYQIHCGPALGSFNQWVLGTELENWRNRYVDKIGIMMMEEAAKVMNKRFSEYVIL